MSRVEYINFGGPLSKETLIDGHHANAGCNGVLCVCRDPERFKTQLSPQIPRSGDALTAKQLLPNISTDGIIRVAHLLTNDPQELGASAMRGLSSEYGVEKGTLRSSKVTVLVAGENFGCGSSREHAVVALQNTGITAVVAPSFGPTFFNNAAYLGLHTSSDMSILKMIQDGQPVPLQAFLEGKSELMQRIIRSGGLFKYLERVRNGIIPEPAPTEDQMKNRPMNIFEKRATGALGGGRLSLRPGDEGFLPVDKTYSYVVTSGLAEIAMRSAYGGELRRTMPAENIHLFEDHFAHSERPQVPGLTSDQRKFSEELGLPAENYHKGKKEEGGGEGICHRVMLKNIDPRKTKVVVATDSHTPTIGALPILALPVGSTLFGAAIAEGKIPFSVPKVMRVNLTGTLPPGASIRDVQLQLAGSVKPTEDNMVVEVGGTGINSFSMDQMVAFCNMTPEVFNASTMVTEPFDAGIKWLSNRLGIPEEEAREMYDIPDKDAEYAQVVDFDLSQAAPWIAKPGSPNNSVSLRELVEPRHIDKAFLVSCTLGIGDLQEAAAVLLDRQVSLGTQLIVIPSSKEVIEEAERLGIYDILQKAGASLVDESACGPCIGEGLGAVTDGEVAITASNRNFPGRMGSRKADVYMGGPILTALSAMFGRIPTIEEYLNETERIMKNLEALRSQNH